MALPRLCGYSTTGLPCVYHDVWLECGSYIVLPRLCGYSTTGLPCVYHDVWSECGSYMTLPRLCGYSIRVCHVSIMMCG